MAEAPSHRVPHRTRWPCRRSPEQTGGRAIGVLLVHGFTGSPASMKPWAQAPRRAGVRRRGAAAARARHALAGPQPGQPGPTGTPRPRRAFDRLRADLRGRRGRGPLDGRLGGAPAGRGARRPGVRRRAGEPVRLQHRKELVALPVLKHVVPSLRGVVNDIKKPDQDEDGYQRLPLKGLAAGDRDVEGRRPRPRAGHPAAALLPLRRRPRHRRVVVADRAAGRRLGRRRGAACSTTATTSPRSTTTPTRIFAESAEFVARVTAP